MERRNWSLEALDNLKYINSLDDTQRAISLNLWTLKYLDEDYLEKLSLPIEQLKEFAELFYQNISFLKQYKNTLKQEINTQDKIKKFLQ